MFLVKRERQIFWDGGSIPNDSHQHTKVYREREDMYTRSNGEDEILDDALLKKLGEERRPVGLNLDVGRLHERGDLLGLARRTTTESLDRSKRD